MASSFDGQLNPLQLKSKCLVVWLFVHSDAIIHFLRNFRIYLHYLRCFIMGFVNMAHFMDLIFFPLK